MHPCRLSLIKLLLSATNPPNPPTLAILFTEVHCGETGSALLAAFFCGSSNSRHKLLWAVGLASCFPSRIHTLHCC